MFERWLVVTDLDGTLLNHHDYSFDAALPVLQRLEQDAVPVIFNTSKTLAEVEGLARQLNNRHPFIVENGSAIFIPKGYFPAACMQSEDAETQSTERYDVIIDGTRVETLQQFVQQLRPQAIDFNQCSVDQAMAVTGLSESDARAAQARQFSVPLLFGVKDEETRFVAQAKAAGFTTLRGGRFLHLLGHCDKGKSMLKLRRLYEKAANHHYGIIALGDSPNDLDMLQAADRAVVVHSPSSHRLIPDHGDIAFTQQSAPEGWAEGVQSILNLDQDDNIQQTR